MAFNSPFVIDSLYCSEDTGEDHFVEESCFNKSNPFPILLEQDFLWEDDELSSLLSKEEQSQMYNCLQTNGNLAVARFNAVDWMLKVTAHHSFSALTAVLAVNYLDRFLFSLPFQIDKPWMTQLGAVACLSLAAKVEETQVPLLLDLQLINVGVLLIFLGGGEQILF
ncbi:cyclin-D3-3-like [Gossypium australe]|uniref:Cyclin-D3-3-like n=1 Tax=Gossypium australe TaxID=47621 RepID=A0A5B6VCK5_9ROSI|nr:cyclin-D3-3-like [Gossypium australe]